MPTTFRLAESTSAAHAATSSPRPTGMTSSPLSLHREHDVTSTPGASSTRTISSTTTPSRPNPRPYQAGVRPSAGPFALELFDVSLPVPA